MLVVVAAHTIPQDALATAVFVAAEFDGASDTESRQLLADGFEAKRGEVFAVRNTGQPTRYVVGLGPGSEVTAATVRHAAGALIRSASRQASITIDVPAWLLQSLTTSDTIEALTEGLILGAYEYNAFKSAPSHRRVARAVLVTANDEDEIVARAIERATAVARSVCLARDLVNEPGGSLTPSRFADIAVEQGRSHGFAVTVWTEEAIRDERLGGLLGVNRGSALPPRFVQLSYDPGREAPVIAICGKGVTFDSGGLSLKETQGMLRMKGDMAGAAAVLAAFTALSAIRPQVRVLGFIPLTDNMTGPDATRIGDVLKIRNGMTVEVLNTDAEGRLILADALALASESRPSAIVDLATLTGACIVALGDRIAGLMGNDASILDRVTAAGEATGEPVWRLPLPGQLRKSLDSDIADLQNVPKGREGGALVAALFLLEFVGQGIPWAHLDIAGPADAKEDDGEVVKGGTGFGVRLLLRLLGDWDA